MFGMPEAMIDVSIWSEVHRVSIGWDFQLLERCPKMLQIMAEEEDIVGSQIHPLEASIFRNVFVDPGSFNFVEVVEHHSF